MPRDFLNAIEFLDENGCPGCANFIFGFLLNSGLGISWTGQDWRVLPGEQQTNENWALGIGQMETGRWA